MTTIFVSCDDDEDEDTKTHGDRKLVLECRDCDWTRSDIPSSGTWADDVEVASGTDIPICPHCQSTSMGAYYEASAEENFEDAFKAHGWVPRTAPLDDATRARIILGGRN